MLRCYYCCHGRCTVAWDYTYWLLALLSQTLPSVRLNADTSAVGFWFRKWCCDCRKPDIMLHKRCCDCHTSDIMLHTRCCDCHTSDIMLHKRCCDCYKSDIMLHKRPTKLILRCMSFQWLSGQKLVNARLNIQTHFQINAMRSFTGELFHIHGEGVLKGKTMDSNQQCYTVCLQWMFNVVLHFVLTYSM